MTHVTEEQLILRHYGESDALELERLERHLQSCDACRREAEAIAGTLGRLEPLEIPEREADYADRVWAQLEPRLAATAPGPLARIQDWIRRSLAPPQLRWAAAMAVLVAVAFLVGRGSVDVPPAGEPIPETVRERILLVAVGDHLEKSRRLLVELVNTDGGPAVDLSETQARAGALAASNRIYRQSAERSADPRVTELLEQLERTLLEVANGPPELAASELEALRRRIERRGLVFRIRVVGEQVLDEGRIPLPAGPEA